MEENKNEELESTEAKAEEVKEEAQAEAEEAKDSKKEKKEKKKAAKDELTKAKEENEKLKEELANLKNEYLKVFAEMQNTKKRINEESMQTRQYASQRIAGELVTPIDMLVQIVNMPAQSDEVKNYQIGFQMIANQLVSILESEGVKKIETLNQNFDPAKMQAMQVEWDETKPEGQVLKVMQQGYMYKDRVLKPAMVVVNKKPEEIKDEKEGN